MELYIGQTLAKAYPTVCSQVLKNWFLSIETERRTIGQMLTVTLKQCLKYLRLMIALQIHISFH